MSCRGMATELKDYESHYDRLEINPECTKTEIRCGQWIWNQSLISNAFISGKPGFVFPCNTIQILIQMMKRRLSASWKSKNLIQVSEKVLIEFRFKMSTALVPSFKWWSNLSRADQWWEAKGIQWPDWLLPQVAISSEDNIFLHCAPSQGAAATARPPSACGVTEATCNNGQCIDR